MATRNAGPGPATEWVFAHAADPDLNAPLPPVAGGGGSARSTTLFEVFQATSQAYVSRHKHFIEAALRSGSGSGQLLESVKKNHEINFSFSADTGIGDTPIGEWFNVRA